MDATVRHLQDRSAIHQLMARYYHCVDRRDFTGVGAVFTDDASVDFATGTPVKGREAIVRYITGVGRYPVTTHFMGNQLVELKADTAEVETYAIAFHRGMFDGKEMDMAIGIRYLDRMVRRRQGWLVALRVMAYDWRRYDPVLTPPPQ